MWLNEIGAAMQGEITQLLNKWQSAELLRTRISIPDINGQVNDQSAEPCLYLNTQKMTHTIKWTTMCRVSLSLTSKDNTYDRINDLYQSLGGSNDWIVEER